VLLYGVSDDGGMSESCNDDEYETVADGVQDGASGAM
jgi:hypothetical protein